MLRAITGQQLSVKAAATIYQRVLDFFDGEMPTPEQILAADPEALNEAGGLSRAKTNYLRSLAEHVVNGELELKKLDDLPDDEVIAELVAVKGIGVWTAQMFLMFHLGREDVLPTGDLGIRRAMMIEYGLDELPAPDRDDRDRRGLAPAPHAGLPLSLGVGRRDARRPEQRLLRIELGDAPAELLEPVVPLVERALDQRACCDRCGSGAS